MNLPISRAFTSEIPTFRVAVWRTVPLAASSTFPYETAFNDTLRRTSFSSSTCVSARRRSSLAVCNSIDVSLRSMELWVSLKS